MFPITSHRAHPCDSCLCSLCCLLQVTITTDPDAQCTNEVFPITYDKFDSMCVPGDSIFVGRYLATGADDSSLFLEVSRAQSCMYMTLCNHSHVQPAGVASLWAAAQPPAQIAPACFWLRS